MLEGLRHQQVEHINLCLRDSGTGPTVVLLHGTTANLGVWDEVVDLLGDGVRTIAVDQRGHGRSDKPAGGYGAVEYSNDIAELIQTLDCGPVVAVGHSLGARNAVVLGAQHPELVAAVVAVDYTPYVEQEVLDTLEKRVADGDRTFDSKVDVVNYLRGRYTLITDDAIYRRAQYGYLASKRGYEPLADSAAMAATVAGLRRDFAEATAVITRPVTLIRGERSAIVSAEAFRRTTDMRPDFRAMELPGVDHYIPEERPDVITEETRRLLPGTTNCSQSAAAFNAPTN